MGWPKSVGHNAMGGKKPASVSRREICWITCESAFVVVSAIAMASGKDDVIRSNARQNVMALVVTRKGFTRETSAHGGPAVMTRSACGYILRIARMRARMLLTLAVAAGPSKCLHHLTYQEEGSTARIADWPLPTSEASLPKSGTMRGLFMPDKDSRLSSDSELRTSMLALVFASSTFKSVNPKLKGPGEPSISNVMKHATASGVSFDFEDCAMQEAVSTAATNTRREK